MQIKVVNAKYVLEPNEIEFRIDRSTALGNPYTHLHTHTLAKYQCSTREKAIENYTTYFYKEIISGNNKKAKDELDKIIETAANSPVVLRCWCKPKSCHGDIIKTYVERVLNRRAFGIRN
jgi:hypothetical protein